MKKTCLVLLLITSITATVHAQLGFEGGVNFSNLAIKIGGDKVGTKFLVGETIGMFLDIRMDDNAHIYFEPGAYYQTNGATFKTTPSFKYIINAANFPLYIEYKSGERCSERFFFGIGPFIGDNISNSAGYNTDVENMDLGIALNLGYIGKKHWFIRGHYQVGLINEYVAGDSKNSIKSSCGSLTIGYMIRGCKNRGWGSGGGSGEGNHWRGIKKHHWSRRQTFRREHWPAYY